MAVAATSKSEKAKNKAANKAKEQHIFIWHGVNRKGKKISGELPARNNIELKAQLRKQGITPSRVKKKPKPLFGMSGGERPVQSGSSCSGCSKSSCSTC